MCGGGWRRGGENVTARAGILESRREFRRVVRVVGEIG